VAIRHVSGNGTVENANNGDYFKDNYLDKKFEVTGTPRSRLKT
jgi:hypothetical protein